MPAGLVPPLAAGAVVFEAVAAAAAAAPPTGPWKLRGILRFFLAGSPLSLVALPSLLVLRAMGLVVAAAAIGSLLPGTDSEGEGTGAEAEAEADGAEEWITLGAVTGAESYGLPSSPGWNATMEQ